MQVVQQSFHSNTFRHKICLAIPQRRLQWTSPVTLYAAVFVLKLLELSVRAPVFLTCDTGDAGDIPNDAFHFRCSFASRPHSASQNFDTLSLASLFSRLLILLIIFDILFRSYWYTRHSSSFLPFSWEIIVRYRQWHFVLIFVDPIRMPWGTKLVSLMWRKILRVSVLYIPNMKLFAK